MPYIHARAHSMLWVQQLAMPAPIAVPGQVDILLWPRQDRVACPMEELAVRRDTYAYPGTPGTACPDTHRSSSVAPEDKA